MEPNSPSTSIPQVASGTQDFHRGARNVPLLRFLRFLLIAAGCGLLFGGIITACVRLIPYNRAVFLPQPPSPNVQVHSVKLAQPGFVVLYLEDPSGLAPMGVSGYLIPGYYRNLVIPVELDPVRYNQGRIMVVRLFKNNGDINFYEQEDVPVRNLFGGVYQKKMSFLYPKKIATQWLKYFLNDPITALGDLLIP